MEELSAKGVTFPIQMDYYVQGSNQSALDTAQVLKQTFIDCLGEDYVVMNIKTFVNSLIKEVRAPQLASFYINGWGADYGDPINYLGQETYGKDNAFYSRAYSKIDLATDEDLIAQYKEFTALVDAAAAINDDLDARYKAFAVAEAYMIEHALVIPLYVNISWQLTGVNDYSKIFAAYGIQNNRYINWETNKQGYTTEDYVNFAKVYEENRK
jgi:oligopeptide transport system substrate-binding protein